MSKSKSEMKRASVQRVGEVAATWEPLESVHPWPKNPRKVTDARIDRIARSFQEFGIGAPIVARRANGEIVAGEGRWRAAKKLGLASYPVRHIDISEEQAHKLALLDNRATELTEWDDDLLREELGSVGVDEAAFLGWSGDELDDLFAQPDLDADDEGEPMEPPKDPVSRLGDIWELGAHRLLCGSCEELSKIVAPKSASLIVTDPPYGVSYAGKASFLNKIDKGNRVQTPIENDHVDVEELHVLWERWFTAVRPLLAPGASYYVTTPQGGEMMFVCMQALMSSGFPLRHMLIWAKDGHVLGRCDYHYQHEPILYGWVEGAGHKRVRNRSETSIWEFPRPKRSDLHPTMKPIELYERAMKNSASRGELVLEPFAGSGTAYIAAERAERVVHGTELSPAYCDVIVERWQRETGGKAKRIEGGA